MKHPNLIRLALTTAIIAALPQVVWADAADVDQNAAKKPAAITKEQAAAQSDTQSLEGIVVTGTATSAGVRKIDASFSITAADLEQIREANPKATADILKISPGLWPESSGGQTGANIEIAGFPGGGDAPFFTNMVQGSPLYGMSSLSFMDSSSLLRLDDTIERVEIVQTGPGVLYGSGQMGATANFILRQGTRSRRQHRPDLRRRGTLPCRRLLRLQDRRRLVRQRRRLLARIRRRPRPAVQVRLGRAVHGDADPRPGQRLVHALGAQAR
jgi:outer membrane receptor protein involved in Fe transport